jgi:hypothetical protein
LAERNPGLPPPKSNQVPTYKTGVTTGKASSHRVNMDSRVSTPGA